jgi:hypothetical protein
VRVEREDSIVVVDLADAEASFSSSSALNAPIEALDAAVSELPRFGLLVLTGSRDDAPRTPGEVRKRWKAWLRSRESVLAERCAGVAMVTSSSARLLLLMTTKRAVQRMFHAPSEPFLDEAKARRWLLTHLAGTARAR